MTWIGRKTRSRKGSRKSSYLWREGNLKRSRCYEHPWTTPRFNNSSHGRCCFRWRSIQHVSPSPHHQLVSVSQPHYFVKGFTICRLSQNPRDGKLWSLERLLDKIPTRLVHFCSVAAS